jgi:hypothetical protein
MTSVVIRPEGDSGQADELKALLRDVRGVAGDEPVRVVSGGVAVSRKVALAFLRLGETSDAATSGHTVDNTRDPLVTIHNDASTGQEAHPDDSHARPDGLVIGGLTPDGEHPGGYEGVRADRRDGQPGDAPAKKSTPAKKTTAAAAQRAGRSSARSTQ